MKTSNAMLVSAALAGLVVTAGCSGMMMPKQSMTDVGECHGVNACKGTGDCHGKGYSCAGNNACKGQGWKKMTRGDCSDRGGEFNKS